MATQSHFFTREDVSHHKTLDDIWVVVDGNVYDITAWIPKHPGGDAPLLFAGKDATTAFHKAHNKGVLDRHQEFLIGHTTPTVEEEDKWPAMASVYDPEADPMGYDVRKSGEVVGSWGAGREFGDHMAHEGEVKHVQRAIWLVYLVLATWSCIAHVATGCHWGAMLSFYIAGMVSYYVWHRIAHEAWSGTVHTVHMTHHLITFPPTDFYGDAKTFSKMYPDGQPTIWSLLKLWRAVNPSYSLVDQAIHLAPLIILMVVVLVVGHFVGGCTGLTLFFAVTMYAGIAIVGAAVHMSFHVRGFHLEKYQWYLELRALHYIHHLGDMKDNFAMVSMYLDACFGSMGVRDPAMKANNAKANISTPLLAGA